jgi:DNA-binding transcriptional LysR family regulator
VQGVLAPSRELDLATLERTFTLRWHESLVAVAGPALLAVVREQAPGVRLRFIAESSVDTPELRRGEVDLEANASPATAADIRAERVAETHQVVVVRRGHPLARAKTITAAQYAAAEHLTVSRRGRLGNVLDEALAKLGLSRNVVAAVGTESAAFAFVRSTDLLVTAPEFTARTSAADLVLLPLPIELPPAPVYLSWHQRYDTDRAHIWLRDLARTALSNPA